MLNLINIPTGTPSCYFHHYGQTIHPSENVSLMTLFKIHCILPEILAETIDSDPLCITDLFQNKLLILYTFLNQMRVMKNIRRKDDRITCL